MLQLLCINNSPVIHPSGIISYGGGLREGELYHAGEITQIHENNKQLCYFIEELKDLRLVSRFVEVSDIDETELARELIEEEISK